MTANFVKPAHKKNRLADAKNASPKSKERYVDNAKFYEECVKFHDAFVEAKAKNLGRPKMSPYAGQCIKMICERLSTMHYFRYYPFREDMVQEGMLSCVQHFERFDVENFKNPFAYFTQIAYYAFLKVIGKERDKVYNEYRLAHEYHAYRANEARSCYDESDPSAPWNQTDVWESDAMKQFVTTYEMYKFKKKSKDVNHESDEKVEVLPSHPQAARREFSEARADRDEFGMAESYGQDERNAGGGEGEYLGVDDDA